MSVKETYFEQVGYKPHARQWLYHRSEARFRVPVCGRRYGKSTMAGRDIGPKLFLPKRRYWIVGPTYDLGEKEFRVIWNDLIIGRQLGKDKRVKKAYNKKQGDMFIEFPWGTRVEVRSADHPELLVGEALHGAIMSEAAKHKQETWERFIRPSLSDHRGWADFPTTPEGHNWLHKLWQTGQNPNEPDFASWRFPAWENTAIYPGGIDDPEIQLLRRTTTREWFEQEIAADFSAFVGKILVEWDEFTHVRAHTFNPSWPNYMCVDAETEILTKRGWLRYGEVREGDETLAINPETGVAEWNVIESVFIYTDGPHDVVRLEGRDFSSVTTHDHRWLSHRQPHGRDGRSGWMFKTTDTLTQADRIPKAMTAELPSEAKYSDALVEVLAWLWTKGSCGRNQTFSIHQSHTVNEANVIRIRSALGTLFLGGWKEAIRDSAPNMTHFYLGAENSRLLWQHLDGHKLVSSDFILSLTRAQLQLFIDVSVMGDGHVKSSGRRAIVQKTTAQLFAVELACHLLGIPTSITEVGDCYSLNLLDRQFNTVQNLSRQEEQTDLVWCVRTRNSNWLARRRGKSYYTGNCFDWGYTNPLAAIEFQVSPWDSIHIWREHYKPFMTLEQHVNYLKGREQPLGYHLDLGFGDCADPEAAAYVSQHLVPCFALPESKTFEGKSRWRESVDLMRSFMKVDRLESMDEYGTPQYVPGYFVDHSCANTIREHNNYRSKDPVKGQNVPELARNADDHAIDAIRYGLMHLFKLGTRYHLRDVMIADQSGRIVPMRPADLDIIAPAGYGGFFQDDGRLW